MASPAKRREALLNEYKGNLYEFLTAQALARHFGVEAGFIKSLRADFLSMLGQQEGFIREFYPELLDELPVLASGLAKQIVSGINFRPSSISLVGKAAAGQSEEDLGESDIILKDEAGNEVFVSVKLSKTGAFVNTKSAGIKSFLSKYFKQIKDIEEYQNKFANIFDREFEAMAYKLHELADVDYSPSFESWKAQGYPQLPGDLEPSMREVFLATLSDVSDELCSIIEGLHKSQPREFLTSLRPLIGYSRADIIQATTFYDKGYKLDYNKVEHGVELIDSLNVIEIVPRENATSFDVLLNDRTLQIRLKAMNKFTGKGFKVNCAVKNIG